MSDTPATLSGGKFCEKCGRAPMACVCGASSPPTSRPLTGRPTGDPARAISRPATSDGTPKEALKKIAELCDRYDNSSEYHAAYAMIDISDIVESWRAGE